MSRAIRHLLSGFMGVGLLLLSHTVGADGFKQRFGHGASAFHNAQHSYYQRYGSGHNWGRRIQRGKHRYGHAYGGGRNHGYGHGHAYRGHAYYGGHKHHGKRKRHRTRNIVGGLIIGGVIAHALTRKHYERDSRYSSYGYGHSDGYAPEQSSVRTACYELRQNEYGETVRIELPRDRCDW